MTDPCTTGGCLCGEVRFEIERPALAASYCHCTRCQGRTGSAASAQAQVDGLGFRILTGDHLVQEWRHPDGGFFKAFCRNCGAHLFSRSPDAPGQMAIRMSAFDADPGVRPSVRSHVSSACSWEPIPDDGLPRYEGSAPRPE
ncbi:MAG: hypothetical protein QOG62_652 [Thermoleophilaceae bacterium]|jgi:hypothetical protein|nr:hypothetical protein [Thermoleophilaceae bacterium]